jgi:polyribonucleotide nucleotidyltransferase
MYNVEAKVGKHTVTIETGKLAKQAGGAVTVRQGDTIVLVTATVSKEARENLSFTPLSVDYVEKTFAAGKIPGGFFKREGRPRESETLTSRFIDRPIRPLFPEGWNHETQVIATVLSADNENESDMLAIIGASAALTISDAPFLGPIAGARVIRKDGSFIVNPTQEEAEDADLDLIVAGSKDAVVMVEGGANNASEDDMLKAIAAAHEEMQPIIAAQEKLQKQCGKEKYAAEAPTVDEELVAKVRDFLGDKLAKAVTIPAKQERYGALDALKEELVAALVPEDDETGLKGQVSGIFGDMKKKFVRTMILKDGKRIDGRTTTDVRPITCEVGLLPRTHGSAVFTRGETQALATTTLGTKEDQQLIDGIGEDYYKRFMLHYNFPPFSVGEVKFLRSPGRREIGHGALAERAVKYMLPEQDDFPYTIRVVSEVLESNGSSSMATVCGSALSLMDAGVPIKAPVAGIAMGLIKEGNDYAILSDILGDEDHLGDMDFKVAGTRDGITALQMDIKIAGIPEDVLAKALKQAHDGRMHILGEMAKALEKPRAELSAYAPKLTVIKIPVDRIGDLIGPGGKHIRGICEETGAKIDVEEDGTVIVAAVDQASGEAALKMVKAYTASPEVGKYYRGKVVRIAEFGAFVEIFPKVDGLVHISMLENKRTNSVKDVVKEGDVIPVKCIEIDKASGKIRLSRKDALDYDGPFENED